MKSVKNVLATLVVGWSLLLVGCAGAEGVRDGVQNGLTTGVSALVQAPILAYIEAVFGG